MGAQVMAENGGIWRNQDNSLGGPGQGETKCYTLRQSQKMLPGPGAGDGVEICPELSIQKVILSRPGRPNWNGHRGRWLWA
jgi:hypothetical protein